MKQDKILWEEGMFLGPQHFQAWERHLTQHVRTRFDATLPLGWGFSAIQVDTDLLANGKFKLRSASGTFRDGTPFDAPTADELPGSRPIAAAFPARARSLDVFLAVRELRPGALLSNPDDPTVVGRFRRREREIVDDISGSVPRMVAIGELDLRILLEGESQDSYQVLPIARIVRDGDAYKLDGLVEGTPDHAAFVPPCLTVGASTVLCEHLRKATENLAGRSVALTRDRLQRQAGTIQLSASEAANFWLLHTINSYLPVLAHYARLPVIHPEQAYRTMAALAGALCTYSTGRMAPDVPAYQHDDLGQTFAALRAWMSDLVTVVVPDTSKGIRMELVKELHRGAIPPEIPESAEFYLGVSCSNPVDRIIALPGYAKVGSPDRVENCRTFNLRGVEMTHVPSPPSDITITPGFHYFLLSREGRFWAEVRQTKTLSLFIPPDYKDVRLECVYVKRAARPS